MLDYFNGQMLSLCCDSKGARITTSHVPEMHSTPAWAGQPLGLGKIHLRREGYCNCSSEDGDFAADERLGI